MSYATRNENTVNLKQTTKMSKGQSTKALSNSTGSSEGESPTEHTSLLRRPNEDHDSTSPLDLEHSKNSTQLLLHEFVVLLRGSVPVILAYALQNSLQTVSVIIVGRLSPEALATAAFAYMVAMASGWLIALGGTTAIDTLASASYTGGSDPHDLGLILQRSFVVLSIFYVPILILWAFAEPIFIALGQEAYLARDAARFLWVLAPGGVGYIYFECLKKYLQAQGEQLL
jgi:MATE family multidrug resistance protein